MACLKQDLALEQERAPLMPPFVLTVRLRCVSPAWRNGGVSLQGTFAQSALQRNSLH